MAFDSGFSCRCCLWKEKFHVNLEQNRIYFWLNKGIIKIVWNSWTRNQVTNKQMTIHYEDGKIMLSDTRCQNQAFNCELSHFVMLHWAVRAWVRHQNTLIHMKVLPENQVTEMLLNTLKNHNLTENKQKVPLKLFWSSLTTKSIQTLVNISLKSGAALYAKFHSPRHGQLLTRICNLATWYGDAGGDKWEPNAALQWQRIIYIRLRWFTFFRSGLVNYCYSPFALQIFESGIRERKLSCIDHNLQWQFLFASTWMQSRERTLYPYGDIGSHGMLPLSVFSWLFGAYL